MCQEKSEFTVYRGISLPENILSKWKKQSKITLDGYSSASRNEKIARYFAKDAETDEKSKVLLKIKVKNENGRHYFSLDSSEYTLYPDEEEVLLQAGLIVQVDEVQEEKGMTIFQVHTSEKLMARNYLT